MKKLLLIFLLSAFMLPVLAQDGADPGPQTRDELLSGMMQVTDEIGDFTITDSDGNTWNLYDELDAGKTVFLDLFFTT